MNFTIQHYNKISKSDLLDVLSLRIKVFVVEQNCPYQEIDDYDKNSYHVFCKNEGAIIAVLRIYKDMKNDKIFIGRVAVDIGFRSHGIARKMMTDSLNYIQNNFKKDVVFLSAQTYLIDFYISLGFNTYGNQFLEDGIPHIHMMKNN